MAFFHVLVTTEQSPDRVRSLLSDLSERELDSKFVQPYRKGTDLVCGNEIVPIAGLRRVHVVRTERDEATERSAFSEKSLAEISELNRQPGGVVFISPGRGYEPEDLLEVAEDVTRKYLEGPPGRAHEPNLMEKVVNHQWTVAIGTGLIVAGLVWWLGWG